MAIIRSDVRKIDTRLLRDRTTAAGQDDIPFIPAYDLYEQGKKRLTEEEVAAVGLALLKLLPVQESRESNWGVASRLQGLR